MVVPRNIEPRNPDIGDIITVCGTNNSTAGGEVVKTAILNNYRTAYHRTACIRLNYSINGLTRPNSEFQEAGVGFAYYHQPSNTWNTSKRYAELTAKEPK